MIHLLCVIFLQILVGGEWGQGVRFSVIHVGSSRGSLLKENGSPIPMLLPCSAGGDPNLIQSLPWGQAQLRGGGGEGQGRPGVELWSQIAATDVVSGRHLVACVRNVRPRLADPWT